jgi:hypothetical protein
VGKIAAGIRLDYLLNIGNAIAKSKELEAILGSPVEKHVCVVVEDGRFRFKSLTPTGETKKDYTLQQQAQAAAIVEKLIRAHRPGHEDLPGVR